MSKRYDKDTYNCAHFLADVWKNEFNQDIHQALSCFLFSEADRGAGLHLRASFEKLNDKQDPCVALMRNPWSGGAHVGAYIRGKIIHMDRAGPRCLPIFMMSEYGRMRFYKCK